METSVLLRGLFNHLLLQIVSSLVSLTFTQQSNTLKLLQTQEEYPYEIHTQNLLENFNKKSVTIAKIEGFLNGVKWTDVFIMFAFLAALLNKAKHGLSNDCLIQTFLWVLNSAQVHLKHKLNWLCRALRITAVHSSVIENDILNHILNLAMEL